MAVEYRVVWKREERKRKAQRFARLASAERKLGILTSDEPWRFFGEPVPDPDALMCCDGRECGCDGATVRQVVDRTRAGLPDLEYAYIESRPVGEWSKPATTESHD